MTERRPPQFPPHSGFFGSLRAAVEAEIAAIERPRDAFAMYAKIAILAGCTVACYAAYLSLSGPIVTVLAVPFGVLLASIGFNVGHDGDTSRCRARASSTAARPSPS